jgi:glycosyltransferase involved in cell wall biosynthesis
MKNVTFDILEPVISEDFKPNKFPAKPIVAVHSRDQRDTVNLIKTFYLKYPQYRWLTLRDMRGLSQSDFADKLSESFVSVWIDEPSSYGTFPLESMKSNVPVIGLVPNVLPNWINEDNGIWVNNKTHIVDVLADHLQNWLEDNVSEEFLEKIKTTVDTLPSKETFESTSVSLFDDYFTVRLTAFEEQISKLQTIEE